MDPKPHNENNGKHFEQTDHRLCRVSFSTGPHVGTWWIVSKPQIKPNPQGGLPSTTIVYTPCGRTGQVFTDPFDCASYAIKEGIAVKASSL